MSKKKYKWDFFLAHAGADKNEAESLYNLLAPHCKVFLDSFSLLLGDDWDQEIPEAQRNSLITIVLVSANTDKAYYQQEEIAGAISMARTDKDKHRVVPVFLENPPNQDAIPYGLRLKHGLYVSEKDDLLGVSKSLLDLLNKLEQLQNSTGNNPIKNVTDGTEDADTSIENPAPLAGTINDSIEAKDLVFHTDINKNPDTNVIAQPEFKPHEPLNPPPSNQAQLLGFVLRCLFANDPNTYFVTKTNLIVTINPFGQAITVGQRIPPMNPNFAWMYQTPYSIYGVTFQGYIFGTFPNGQTIQIGYVTNV